MLYKNVLQIHSISPCHQALLWMLVLQAAPGSFFNGSHTNFQFMQLEALLVAGMYRQWWWPSYNGRLSFFFGVLPRFSSLVGRARPSF